MMSELCGGIPASGQRSGVGGAQPFSLGDLELRGSVVDSERCHDDGALLVIRLLCARTGDERRRKRARTSTTIVGRCFSLFVDRFNCRAASPLG